MSAPASWNPLTPPAWLGVLGGGQLGRMFIQAAQALGYRVLALDPDPGCPSASVADRFLCAAYDDPKALAEMAAQCQAVTTEFENVPAASLEWLAQHTRVAPSAQAVAVCQDRIAEKTLLQELAANSGAPPAPWHALRSAADLEQVDAALFPAILKTARMGYDGRGQCKVENLAQLRTVFAEWNCACVLEKRLALASEISVLAMRGKDGAGAVYAPAQNLHRNGILHTSLALGDAGTPQVSAELCRRAQDAAQQILAALDFVGLACVEFFVLQDGQLVANEIAPRPHNSGHHTLSSCDTSQFEQQVRALCGLAPGSTRQHSPALMLNLLGDIWFADGQTRNPAWERILALPGAALQLYGKQPRAARKMGHLTLKAEHAAALQVQLEQACAILGIALEE
ncbi:5-(carboxyamino)imidazole ribonucleotide synthase [Massilia sp. W12]|uniref:5-(carboxyamino)imidazole ribonucleotide synthase n=1 Tax=Massilia sp. W12 TaxID=3126507 RepID=UPI0030D359A8